MFFFSLWAVSPFGSGVGLARPPLVVGAAPFLLMVGLRTSEASLRALSYRWVSWWSSLRPSVFGCP